MNTTPPKRENIRKFRKHFDLDGKVTSESNGYDDEFRPEGPLQLAGIVLLCWAIDEHV